MFICIWLLYYGVTGMAGCLQAQGGITIQFIYSISGYVLFILIPLMIVALALCDVISSEFFEWGFAVLVIAVVLDIIILIVFYLLS